MAYTPQLNDLRRSLYETLNFVSLYQSLFINLPFFRRKPPQLESSEEQAQYEELIKSANTFDQFVTIDRFQDIYRELWVTRIVDALNHYLVKSLYRAYEKRPSALKAKKESVSNEKVIEVLESGGDIHDLVRQIAIQRVERLGYESLIGLTKYLQDQHGLDLDTNSAAFAGVKELIEVRNIIVHNNGVVNRTFLLRTGRADLAVDSRFPLSSTHLSKSLDDVIQLAEQVDREFVAKFDLETEENWTWEGQVGRWRSGVTRP